LYHTQVEYPSKLRDRVKRLEAENRELRAQLEVAYGRFFEEPWPESAISKVIYVASLHITRSLDAIITQVRTESRK
jgi:hypothetical protein